MEPEVTQGQADNADLEETTAPAPEGQDAGQSATPEKTTGNGSDQVTGESFFDPKSIEHSPELMQAYKQMQGNFSKHMQTVRSEQAKIEAYNQAMQDPVGTIRQLANQYGMTVVNGGPQGEESREFNPKNWDDVTSHIRSQVAEELRREYEPLLGEVKSLKRQNIEQYLDSNYVDWRTYETEMINTLRQHPSMANDPDTLYRLSVPQSVIEARATERALKKLKSGADAGAVPGAAKATQSTSDKPTGKLSFNEAVEYAKSQLRKRGITGPVGG